jgi:hypothetical protein
MMAMFVWTAGDAIALVLLAFGALVFITGFLGMLAFDMFAGLKRRWRNRKIR